MSEFWKKFYKKHVDNIGEDPYLQVGRSLNSEPMSDVMFKKMTGYLIEKMEIEPDHLILDLCCGNGLLSEEMAHHCQSVTGVDFSEKLIADISKRQSKNITGICADVMKKKFQPESFDRILFAAALQHFTKAQTISLFKDIFFWLKPRGILMISDITDNGKIWDFYNSKEREALYFQSTLEENSPLGTWYDRIWLEKLAHFVGFNDAKAMNQPDDYWYSHYRFDLLCHK